MPIHKWFGDKYTAINSIMISTEKYLNFFNPHHNKVKTNPENCGGETGTEMRNKQNFNSRITKSNKW